MTSLSDKVARVKERMKQAEPYREIWSNEFHVIDQQNAIIQKQREVLVMAREVIAWMDSRIPEPEAIGIGDDGHPEYINDENHGWAWEKHRLGKALTAIDNVMKN